MAESSSSSSSGIGVFGLLGVAFVVLKLTHYINWSWWWVTMPFWIGLAIFFAILFGGAVIIGIMALFAVRSERNKITRRGSHD